MGSEEVGDLVRGGERVEAGDEHGSWRRRRLGADRVAVPFIFDLVERRPHL